MTNQGDGLERRLLAVERRQTLAELVRQDPVVTVDELAKRFRVSAQTVRRDFQSLEEQGVLTRTYGGAVTRTDKRMHLSHEAAFLAREQDHAAEKFAIAEAAVPRVEPGSIVIFDASTTVLQLARALPLDIELTAIVNALPIAMELSRRPNVMLTALGGQMRETSLSFTGPLSEATLRRLFADTAFISARGLSVDRGLTEANPSESALKGLMIAQSTHVAALVDSSKLGRTALSPFADLAEIDYLVTDDGADPTMVQELGELGLCVKVAAEAETTTIHNNGHE
jgi:DeoR family fructose operon transcriptional repressor